MLFNNMIRFMVLIVIGLVIYFRDHYYLIVIVGIIFLAYKFGLHNKIYKVINKISGNTKNVVADKNKKSKYLKKLSKNNGGVI